MDVGGAVQALSLGGRHTCALLSNGDVRCWGQNSYGQLGYGNKLPIGDDETPASVSAVNVGGDVVQVSAGESHTCALLATGEVRCWGAGATGRPWPRAPSSSAGACRLLSQFYARFFGAYFIFVNRTGTEGPFHFWGGSQIVDPFGETEATAKYGEPDLLVHTLELDKIRQARLKTPLRRDEDVSLTIRELARINSM